MGSMNPAASPASSQRGTRRPVEAEGVFALGAERNDANVAFFMRKRSSA